MKTRVLLYLALAALACAHAPLAKGRAQSQSESAAVWSRYTYEDEEFSVELPGMPTVYHTVRGINKRPYGEE